MAENQRLRKDSMTAVTVVPCPQKSDLFFLSLQPELFNAEFPSLGDFFGRKYSHKDFHVIVWVPALVSRDLLTQCTFLVLLPVEIACGSCVFCCQQRHVLAMLRVCLLTQSARKTYLIDVRDLHLVREAWFR